MSNKKRISKLISKKYKSNLSTKYAEFGNYVSEISDMLMLEISNKIETIGRNAEEAARKFMEFLTRYRRIVEDFPTNHKFMYIPPFRPDLQRMNFYLHSEIYFIAFPNIKKHLF